MVVNGAFSDRHVYRIYQLGGPVVVLMRAADQPLESLSLLYGTAKLNKDFQFVLTLRLSNFIRSKVEIIEKVRNLSNVHLGVIDDMDDKSNIVERRYEQLSRLARRAKDKITRMAV